MTEPIGVTVVVPTLNRGGFLYDCLQDLLAQEHRPLEIFVVDQSEIMPGSVQHLLDTYPDLINYHTVSFRGLPTARNYGLKHARYDAIVFVDDDTRIPPNFVGEHLRALQLSGVGAVAGGITERGRVTNSSRRAGQFNYWTATPEREFSQAGYYDVDHVPGCNFSTWRPAALDVGGFEKMLNVGAALYEETEFCLRIKHSGHRIFYNSEAHLEHLVGATGGCRVEEIGPYVWALAHNRVVVIRRHLKWFQQPIAFAELFRLGLAYAIAYRRLQLIWVVITGSLAGVRNMMARDLL